MTIINPGVVSRGNTKPLNDEIDNILTQMDVTDVTYKRGRAFLVFLNDNLPETLEWRVRGSCLDYKCFCVELGVKTQLDKDSVKNLIEAMPQRSDSDDSPTMYRAVIGQREDSHVCLKCGIMTPPPTSIAAVLQSVGIKL